MRLGVFRSALAGALVLLATPALASSLPGPSHQCLTAGKSAARDLGIPEDLLLAIALVESGRKSDRKTVPWPWTINVDGKGTWFSSKGEAITHVRKLLKQGIRSIDVGCFQINLRWHPKAFRSLEEAFDPTANARYAAGFLKSLRTPGTKWIAAAGAYHSGNEEFAALYRMRVQKVLGNDQKLVALTPARWRALGGIELVWYETARSTGLLTSARGPMFAPRTGDAQP